MLTCGSSSVMQFAQMFGGSLFVSVAQNIFTNHLVSGLKGIPGVDATSVVNAGATQITSVITDPATVHDIKVAYNNALTKAFEVALIMNCLCAIAAAGMKWKNLHSKKSSAEPEGEAETPAA